MSRHEFDPLSLVFGLLFLLGGLPLLISKSGLAFFEGRWVFPAFLVVAGVIVLASAQFTKKDDGEAQQDGSFSFEDPYSD